MRWLGHVSGFLIGLLIVSETDAALGFAVETGSGISFFDRAGEDSFAQAFVRVSRVPRFRSRTLTPELSFSYLSPPSHFFDTERARQVYVAQVVFYEFFGQQSFRFGLGMGADRYQGQWTALGQYRIGLGHYFSQVWGLHLDFTGRALQTEGFRFQNQFELSLGLMTRL